MDLFTASALPPARTRAEAGAVGPVEEVHERAELRVGLGHGVQQLAGLAAEDHEAVADRAVRVLGREHRRRQVVGPREPEQVALVGVAGRVVGERVEQVVEALERPREVRRDGGEVAQRRAQLLDGRQRGARERAQLVADDRRRRAQERPHLRSVGPSARAAGRSASSVGPSSSASAFALAERGLRHLQRGRQLAQRLADRRVLAGEAGEDRVGADDEVGDRVVLVAQLLRHQREVVDRALDVRRALGQRLVHLAGELGGRLDPADRLPSSRPLPLSACPPSLSSSVR